MTTKRRLILIRLLPSKMVVAHVFKQQLKVATVIENDGSAVSATSSQTQRKAS